MPNTFDPFFNNLIAVLREGNAFGGHQFSTQDVYHNGVHFKLIRGPGDRLQINIYKDSNATISFNTEEARELLSFLLNIKHLLLANAKDDKSDSANWAIDAEIVEDEKVEEEEAVEKTDGV